MERQQQKRKIQAAQHLDDPVEFDYQMEHQRKGPKGKRPQEELDVDSESESESEEEYVAYGRADVEVATDAVVGWLRRRFAPPSEKQPAEGSGEEAQSEQADEKLPHTRREWTGQADVGSLCRVERKVEGLAVLGLLHQARLVRLLPPGGEQQHTEHDSAEAGDGDNSDENDEDKDAAAVRELGPEETERVGVEWVVSSGDVARLEEAIAQQLGDGSIILARVLHWLRPRLLLAQDSSQKTASKKGGPSKRKGKKEPGKVEDHQQQQQQGRDSNSSTGLPRTLPALLAIIEQEQWGVITHRVSPSDVLHELELNEMVEVAPDGKKLRYNKAKILAKEGVGGNGWKWLLGILLLLFMMLPSWLH